MAMTDPDEVRRAAAQLMATSGDAVRWALAGELLTVVAATVRFLLLGPATWMSQRYTEPERDTLRGVAERLEQTTVEQMVRQCPLCSGCTCEDGCPLESVRELAQARPELADATPTTEANQQ